MQEKKNNLEASWKQRKENALKLANETIEQLLLHKEAVNFNSVHVQSGLSKSSRSCICTRTRNIVFPGL